VAPKSEPIWQTVERGKYGVELFFVLSGFVLALPFAAYHARGARRVDLASYYLRRVTRFEPPYIVALTAYFLVRAATGDQGEGLAPGFPHYVTRIFYIHKFI
jgi:peptidoglycan/LPS O-acetylase OafA/YrhL